MENRETLAYLVLRDHEDIEDPPDPWDRLESLDQQVLEDLRVRWATLELLADRERLGSLAGEVLEVRLVSLVTREHRDCLVWRVEPDHQDLLDPQARQVTQYL